MTDDHGHSGDMRPREPLAKLVSQAMDAAGLNQADVAKISGLSSQLVSQILNRKTRYQPHRLPGNKTMQGLAKLPGVTILDVTRAVRESAGIDDTPQPASMTSGLRRNVHNVVDEFPDDRLAGVLQVLLALRDFTRNGGNHRR